MDGVYEFFEIVKECKDKKIDPTLKFQRYSSLCDQPERSKREDLPKWASRAVMMPDGLCHFEDGKIIDSKQPINEGCGTLNSMET